MGKAVFRRLKAVNGKQIERRTVRTELFYFGLVGPENKVSGVSVQVSGTTRISRAGLDSAELVAGYADHILKWAVI